MVEESTNSEDKRVCSIDPTHETYIKKNSKPDWRHDENGNLLCKRCHNKLITNPKWNPIYSKINNPRRITYKGKQLHLKEAPRIGVCNWCRAVVPFDCSKTQLHHEEYDDNNILANTIEVCPRCHIETKNFDTEKNRAALEFRRKNLVISERNEKGQIVKYKYKTKEREG